MSVLIVGGYGVVGTEIAHMIRRHYKDLRLVIAGRSLEKATSLAQRLGNAEGLKLDLNALTDTLPGGIKPTAIISAVKDVDQKLLKVALLRGINMLDFASAGQSLRDAVDYSLHCRPSSSLGFVSNWMAGVPAVLAKELASSFEAVDEVDLDILYYGDDKSGPDTATVVSEFALPYITKQQGQWTTINPLRDPKLVDFPSGLKRRVRTVNMPDVTSLPFSTGANTVNVKLGLDDPAASLLASWIVRSGIWHLFTNKMKEAMLFNPGDGAVHEFVITVRGMLKGELQEKRLTALDPKGQVHLTALGVVHMLEAMLGLYAGSSPLGHGVAYAETIGDPIRLRELLGLEGIQLMTPVID